MIKPQHHLFNDTNSHHNQSTLLTGHSIWILELHNCLPFFSYLEWATFLLHFCPFAPAIQNGSSFSLHTFQIKRSDSMLLKSQYFNRMTPHFFIMLIRVRAQENLFTSFEWKLLKGFLLNVETALGAFYSNSPRDGVMMPFLSTYSCRIHFSCYI